MLYEITIPQSIKMLGNLKHMLDKGAAHATAKKFEMDVLLNARLAPDQFELKRQVQIACDSAKFTGARLTGKTPPVNEDNEKTLAELQARIDSTVTFLRTLKPEDFKGAEERRVGNKFWEDKTLSGWDAAIENSVPNLYFHIMTTYSILRHNGVDVGKKDYLGELPLKKV